MNLKGKLGRGSESKRQLIGAEAINVDTLAAMPLYTESCAYTATQGNLDDDDVKYGVEANRNNGLKSGAGTRSRQDFGENQVK